MDCRHSDIRIAWLDTTVIHCSLSAATKYSKLSSSLASWSFLNRSAGLGFKGVPDVMILQHRIRVTLKTTSFISPLGVYSRMLRQDFPRARVARVFGSG